MKRSSGFSLLEMMMSISIFTIVMMGALKMVVDQRRAYQQADQYLELQGKVRAALDIISAEIRMAGSGINQPFANPIYYAFNDNTTLTSYPTLSDLKDPTLEGAVTRSLGAIGFQYDRSDTKSNGTDLRNTITNGDVMLIAMTSMDNTDTILQEVTMETYTDEGATALTGADACSLVATATPCEASYVSSGATSIKLRGDANTDLFKLNMYTMTSSGANYDSNEILDYVISFDVTYYLDASDNGYTDTVTRATATGTTTTDNNLGDNVSNDGDVDIDEKGELATITSTKHATGLCDGGKVLCEADDAAVTTDGYILTMPLKTRSTFAGGVITPVAVTDASTVSPPATDDIYDISSAAAVTFTTTPTITAGTEGDYLILVNGGLYPITFTDDDTLAGSDLELKRSTVTLSPNQSLKLQYTASKWVQTSPAVANIAAVKITLTARSEKRDPRNGKYLVYSGTITTKLRGYAL